MTDHWTTTGGGLVTAKKAIAEIEWLGGSVMYAEKSRERAVISVSLAGTEVTDALLEHLRALLSVGAQNGPALGA